MITHPDIVFNWQAAKKAAAAIARAANCQIIQMPDGTKGVRLPSGNVKPCETWLGAYELVSRIRRDQLGIGK